MTQAAKIYLILGAIIIVLILLWAPLRSAIGGIFTSLLTPAVLATLATVFLWTFWILKSVFASHIHVLKNLLMPHKVVFRSLENEDTRKL